MSLLGESGTISIVPVEQAPSEALEAGACGSIVIHVGGASATIGHIGLLSASVQKTYELELPAAVAELELAPLMAA